MARLLTLQHIYIYSIYIYMYVCFYIHICVNRNIYIYIYTHIHTCRRVRFEGVYFASMAKSPMQRHKEAPPENQIFQADLCRKWTQTNPPKPCNNRTPVFALQLSRASKLRTEGVGAQLPCCFRAPKLQNRGPFLATFIAGEHPGDHNHQDFPRITAIRMGGVLQYKWEAYGNTNGRSTDSISLSLERRGTASTVIHIAGVLQYKLEEYCNTFLKGSGWGF